MAYGRWRRGEVESSGDDVLCAWRVIGRRTWGLLVGASVVSEGKCWCKDSVWDFVLVWKGV